MKCIVEINGRYLVRVVDEGFPMVSDCKAEATVMSGKQAFIMADHFEKEFDMKTAVLQLITMYSKVAKREVEAGRL